ncbi:MAG TPA: radical SAM protein [Terriglobia bacterium]|nr:radical SAM protein [Terriglobia bacterium]
MTEPTPRPTRSQRFRAFAAYVKRNRSFLGRVFRQYARNTVSVRMLKRTRVVEPLSAIFYVTHRCNLSCHYCTQKYPDILSQELPTDRTIEILRVVSRELRSLYVTGGEPTCRIDLEQILAAAAGFGFNTILHTNGVLLDRREKLLDSIASLVISLDSMNEGRFDSVTQSAPGTTRRIVQNIIDYGRHMQSTGRCLTINCVIDARTLDDVPEVMEFCRQHNLIFSCCSALKNDLTPYELLENARYQRLVDHILATKRSKRQRINGSAEELEYILRFKDFNCYPTLFARIYPNGDVYYPCVPLKTVGGNVLETPSLKEIYRRARAKFGEVPDCRGRCHLYSNITSHFYVHKFWNLAAEYK